MAHPTSALLTYQGETKSIQTWSKEFGISVAALDSRVYVLKWPIEKALTTPTQHKTAIVEINGLTLPLHEWLTILGISRQGLT